VNGDSPDPTTVALVGYGLGGSAFHAPLIASTPGLELVAVVTSDPARRAEAAARYPSARIPAGVEELLGQARPPDLVVVSVPNRHHFAVAELALRAGSSVVLDKPVTPTSEEARQLCGVADDAGVSLIPYHNRRWDGDFRTVRSLLGTGRLGTVWRFESRFERWKPGQPDPRSWKQDPSAPGAGILFDLGSHLVDQVICLFGLPAGVYAEVVGRGGPPDDDVFMALAYPRGPQVHLWASSRSALLGPRFRVLGSDGAYVKFGLDPQESALRAGTVPSAPGWGEEPADLWGRLGSVAGDEELETLPGAYQEFYAGVAAHLREGAPPPVPMADAVDGLRVLEAAKESALTGGVVAFR
jgi:scyllo-inositol 2-dehydrogenase (NADP+)